MMRLCGSWSGSEDRASLAFIANDPRLEQRLQAGWLKVTTASRSKAAVGATLIEVSRNPNIVTCSGPSPYGSQSGYRRPRAATTFQPWRAGSSRLVCSRTIGLVASPPRPLRVRLQKLSGEISAEKQKIARAQQSHGNMLAANTQNGATPDLPVGSDRRGVLVDAWG